MRPRVAMMDRLLKSLLWTTIMGLIAVMAGAALYLAYSGGIALLGGDAGRGAGPLAGGLVMAGAALGLCRYSNDLIDR